MANIINSIKNFFTVDIPNFFTVDVPKFFTEDIPNFFKSDVDKGKVEDSLNKSDHVNSEKTVSDSTEKLVDKVATESYADMDHGLNHDSHLAQPIVDSHHDSSNH